ncbi:MAG: hypothetical protein H7840_13040 [Alphaproteobacteria bacterium]
MAIVKFLVNVSHDERWILDTAFGEEAKARAHAQNLVKDPKNDGVRVIREKRRTDGGYDEEVLFEALKKGEKKKDVSLSEISSAPVCDSLADLYRAPSRGTINRLFSKYLDDAILTPTELVHSYKDLKRLLDNPLVQGAVDKVSTLQAAATETDARTRRDQLSGWLDQALARARKASERTDLPSVKAQGFAEAVGRIDASAPAEDRDFLALVALSRELVELRAWAAKMERVLAEMERAGPGRAMDLLDSVLADLCGARGVVVEMIGAVPNLGGLLIRLLDLVAGRLDVTGRAETDVTVVINRRLAAGDLPETRAELAGQFQRQLGSGQPLARNEPKVEFDIFRQLLERVVTPTGVVGGFANAEAMALRYMRFLSTGGMAGRREAIQAVTSHLPTAMQQVRFLIALSDSPVWREQLDYIIGTLESLIGKAQRMEDLVGLKGTPKTRMQEIVQIYAFVRQTTALPERVTSKLAEKLDALVADFLVNNQVLEKLDSPSESLRIRAVRLVQFCTSGVLTEGRAFTMARERVLTLLKQPKFDEKFVADIPDAAAREKSLRDFHLLLARSKFLQK